jgi:hypothetical protein
MPPIPKSIGKYEIVEFVGRGGMGVLYRAHDPVLDRDVALKMMLVDFTADQSARERFEREARAVARLQHRNVVTIHELGDFDGTPFIVMEFLGGKDLDERLRSGVPMTLAEKLDVVIQLCDGLGYAHEQGIVHRDVKPGNVRLLDDGTVKILDFGIAKFAMSSVTQSGSIMGTPSYMAPEQITGTAVDGRADLFATGVLLYELITGKKPFTGESPTTVVYQIMHVEPPMVGTDVSDLPDALNEIVARALKKNPDERYTRASELASDLQMVRMMLDFPLHPEDSGSRSKTGPLAVAKLYATTIGARPSTAVLAPPMRASPEAAAADAAARGTGAGANRTIIATVAAGVVGLAAFGAFYLTRSAATPASTQGAGAAAGGNAGVEATSASSPTPAGSVGGARADVIVVSTSPAGARIALNGSDTGQVTPAAVSLGGRFPGALALSLKGYQPLTVALTESDAQSGKKDFKLVREAGPVRLIVSASYPFEILQGSRVLSTSATRHEVTVQPGGSGLVARNPEFLLNTPLAVDFGRSQAEVSLPAAGTLAVFSAVETCSVVVDGQDLGFPPIPRKAAAAGGHTVTLKCAEGKDEVRRVTVAAGERTAVTFAPKP